ncbi:MAG TPA: hypothetical protein VI488_04050 [Candidatus Angelobacter sp.]
MKFWSKRYLLALVGMIALTAVGNLNLARAEDRDKDRDHQPALQGRIVAVGIPGASAITPVGNFVPTGPIPTLANLKPFIQPGQVLDPVRILVGSTSNFGEPLANTDQREGSFLSIDPSGAMLVIPPDFASAGGQVSALGGRVQMYTANNAAFLNSIENPNANTKTVTGASNPLGISLNWAFGRLWPVNAPTGLEGAGTSSILDPQGWGLKGAPNPEIGGEYEGNLTNRGAVGVPGVTAQVIPGGLNTGAIGTALLGMSPDGSKKAVFAVVEADGSVVQEHTLQGLDGLAGPGTISPLIGRRHDDDEDKDGDGGHGVTPRLGVVFKWETISNNLPSEILYVSEPYENRIAALVLTNNGVVFQVAGMSQFSSDALDQPVDLTPVNMEATDPGFASNTTLDGDSDFYVANRGNNTIVRMTQKGVVVSVRRVTRADGMPLGDARLNGIATSQDGTKIWVTVTGHLPGVPHSTGAVLELPAF